MDKIILVVLVISATLTECIVMRKSREYDRSFEPCDDPVERCRDCGIHGHCATEYVFSFVGISNPFCCAWKRKEGDGNG